ncbi:class I SAM-dependent methyltransferase [Nonomuraea sp. NPDC049480]|uniref:class I SAM-dependent methyltransferase n=1 Tax=Nonomuraea sp. NPDC049480 TaxID=3364353 RepID=UPI0037A05E34
MPAGPTGSVVGIDQSVKALAFTAYRTEQRGLPNVSFVHDDLHTVPMTGEFDAVVGRLVSSRSGAPAWTRPSAPAWHR